MKKKLFAVLLLTATVLFLPKNTFAKTLEINYPSNFVTYQELSKNYTLREGDFYNIGSTSEATTTMANPITQEAVLAIEFEGNKIRFSKLSGVTDDDLTSPITQEFRDNIIAVYGVDIYEDYDTIKMNVKEFDITNTSDITIDFTKYEDYWDMNAYENNVLGVLQRQNLYITDSPFYTSNSLAGVNGDSENYDEIISRDGKSLVKMFYLNSNTPFKIKIQDGVTYKDNITYILEDNIKEALANDGYNVDKITLIFGHEPDPVNTVKNTIRDSENNPATLNNKVLIIAILSICTVSAISVLKKKNN